MNALTGYMVVNLSALAWGIYDTQGQPLGFKLTVIGISLLIGNGAVAYGLYLRKKGI